MIIKERMEPTIPPSALHAKSWDNFPKISLTLNNIKHNENYKHHKILKNANYFKLTLIGCYNFITPHSDKMIYTAVTKMPLQNEMV